MSTLSNFMVVYARCVTGNVLQNNRKGHWEVKIISIAVDGKVNNGESLFPVLNR